MSETDPTVGDIREQFVAGAMVTGFAFPRAEARDVWEAWLSRHDAALREQIATEIEEYVSKFEAHMAATSKSDPLGVYEDIYGAMTVTGVATGQAIVGIVRSGGAA